MAKKQIINCICAHVLFKRLRKICSVLRLSTVFTLESLPDPEGEMFSFLSVEDTNVIIGAKCNKGPKCSMELVPNVVWVPNVIRNWC